MTNPFQLTRAADLDDDQILKLWVDPNGDFGSRLRPSSPLPMVILGGRGSGKTHLLRYFSYLIQRKIHSPAEMLEIIKKSGYIGIHTRCRGLSASRFAGKGLAEEQWRSLFGYHLELWMGQMILQTTRLVLDDAGLVDSEKEKAITGALCELFDRPPGVSTLTLASFAEHLRRLQKGIDLIVNNASFRRSVEPSVELSPGSLIFGIPKVLADGIPELQGIMFTLFVDEYEHLYLEQQKHFNTLIRERENPVSFKIGARPHGLKTHKTWGGDEELKEGSDYELLNLDAELRRNEAAYSDFARKLCISRIRFSQGGQLPEGWDDENAVLKFEKTFEPAPLPEDVVVAKLRKKNAAGPWLHALDSSLVRLAGNVEKLGIKTDCDRQDVLGALRFSESAIVEKANCYLFYQSWSRRENLAKAAIEISASARAYHEDRSSESIHARRLSHFRKDLIAQMLSEMQLSQNGLMEYIGLDSWIQMSQGITRNLITALKNVYDWAIWKQESIYCEAGISLGAQVRGTSDTSNWFLNDAKVLGEEAGLVAPGLNRICHLLKELRYSEKLPECSLCTFSVELSDGDALPARVLKAAEQWSLLVRMPDRKERNSGAHVMSYRVNGMIAPNYLLPVSSRGNIHLKESEVQAIFGNLDDKAFFEILKQRMDRCRPPFERRKIQSQEGRGDELGLF